MTLFAGIALWVVFLFPCAVPGFGPFSGGTTMEIPDSSVGTLFPFVKKIAERNPVPKYRFLREEFISPESWRRQAQPLVMANLHYEPAPVDPKPEVIEKVDLGTHSREYIRFNTTPESRISGYVLVPKGEGPFPALVALHDHGAFYLWGKEKLVRLESEHPALVKFRETCYGGVAIADELAKRGYVVAVIDMLYWGERRMLLPGDPEGYLTRSQELTEEEILQFNRRSGMNEQIFARTLMAAGTTWFGVIHWDDRRTVDYLLTRPEVDPNRIGCVGLSVGGYRAVHLTALDDRIRAGVGVGWMCTYGSMLQKHIPNGIGLTKIIPGTYEYLDLPDIAALSMPRPLMVINGTKDGLFPWEGVQNAYQILRDSYQKAGVPERFQAVTYEGPHEFNREMQEVAFAWLDRWVKNAEGN